MEITTRKRKPLKKWFFGILFFFISIFIGMYFYLRTSLPPMDGTLKLDRLTSPVKIIRDQEGIPHIYGNNKLDLYRALGFTIASERLFHMEMARRLSSGELSELVGEKALASDKMFRTLRLRSSISEVLERKKNAGLFDPAMIEIMDAFYDGVNQFQNRGILPIEFKILGITPRPFTSLDGYAFAGLMSFNFAIATHEEPLFTRLRTRLGEEWVNEMRIDKISGNKSPSTSKRIVEKSQFSQSSVLKEAMAYITESGLPLFEGSNGWLLAGKRTASGSPILSNDPHITFSHPGVWFEAHLKSPDFETYGHFLPNIPFPVLAHNRDRAFGFTMSLMDDMDLFKEELNTNDKTYRFKDKHLPYREYVEQIKVKGKKDVPLKIIVTQHGPILDEILSDKSLALNWVYYNPLNDAFTSLYQMGIAKNMEEFRAAVATGVAPGLNVLYADKKNIAWWIFGQVPLRAPHVQSDFVHDGANGKDEYVGYMKFEAKPHLENPESGVIVSANARPEGYPADQRGDWQPNDRYLTIKTLLEKKEKWSVDEIKELQTLSLNLEHKLILTALLKETKESSLNPYLEILSQWDFISSIDAIAPSIYHIWCLEISKILLKDLSNEEQLEYSKLPASWIFFKRVVLDPNSVVWKKFKREEVFSNSLSNTIAILKKMKGEDYHQWNWGKIHTLEFSHPFSQIPLLKYIFNVGPFPTSGNFNEINNQKAQSIDAPFLVKAGPSTRRIVDFSHPEVAHGILPVGESGHLLSPFYKNQVERFLKGEYRSELLDDKLIETQKTHELILQ